MPYLMKNCQGVENLKIKVDDFRKNAKKNNTRGNILGILVELLNRISST